MAIGTGGIHGWAKHAAKVLGQSIGKEHPRGVAKPAHPPGGEPSAKAPAMQAVSQRFKHGAGVIARVVGPEGRKGIPRRIKQTLSKISNRLGVLPQRGVQPGRYWPIVFIAAALAESVHAPLLNSALAMMKRPDPGPRVASGMPEPGALSKGKTDMTGPGFPDHYLNNLKNSTDGFFGDVFSPKDPLVYQIPTIDPHATIDLIHTGGGDGPEPIPGGGGGADITPTYNPPTNWNGTISGGGGGADIGPGFSGTGGGGTGGSGGGGHSPVIVYDPVPVSVPEPGSLTVLVAGLALLGHRKSRRVVQ